MAERRAVLIRLDPKVHASLRRWADDELRSLNAQVEYVLRRALRDAGRLGANQRQNRPSNEPTDP
ncbi:MAG TPA: hypothetical protein QGG47_03700 [Acidobacteriota bacterium]|nr:hypothetical protein [Acidobacteriota bacterium]